MYKRKATSYGNRPFKKPRQTAGAAMYNTFARAGAFARPSIRRSIGMMSRRSASLKGVDTNLALNPVLATTGTNGSAFLLNAVAPGSGSFNRIGRKVSMKSLRLKGAVNFQMTPSGIGSVTGNCMRMVIVYDRQPNSGTIPTWDTIFGVTDQAGTETSTIASPLKYDNMDRFRVIKDKTIDVATVTATVVTTGVIDQYVNFDEFMSLKGLETTYSGQSATCTIADISTGALYVYFRAHVNSGGNNQAVIDGDSIARLRYAD